MKKNSLLIFLFFLVSCAQERYLFIPTHLNQNYQYSFEQPFEEIFIPINNEIKLNALLFQQPDSKGLIFFIHGNGGDLSHWGKEAKRYLDNQYDFFVFDFRNFGKSNGKINSEKQLHQDVQIVYDQIKQKYQEKDIIILGFSFGTGLATKLASENSPKVLILLAPYFSMIDLIHSHLSLYPKSRLKYQLPTYEFIQKVKSPIYIFHGKKDNLIRSVSTEKLIPYLKPTDQVFFLEHGNHDFGEINHDYHEKIKIILKELAQKNKLIE